MIKNVHTSATMKPLMTSHLSRLVKTTGNIDHCHIDMLFNNVIIAMTETDPSGPVQECRFSPSVQQTSLFVCPSKSQMCLPLVAGPHWCRCSLYWWLLLSRKSSRIWYDKHLHHFCLFYIVPQWILHIITDIIKANQRMAPVLSHLGTPHCSLLFIYSFNQIFIQMCS